MTPRTPSFTDFDRPYRRGVVLGLSLAELFLILAFLLLLAMVGYAAIVAEEIDQLTEANRTLEQKLIAAQEENEQVKKDAREATERAVAAGVEAKKFRDYLTAIKTESGNPIGDEYPLDLIAKLQRKIDDLSTDTKDLKSQLAAARTEIEGPTAKPADEEKKSDELGNEPAAVTDKGHEPPCWYEVVTEPGEKPRERGLYIFHIKIHDSRIFVKDIPPPDKYAAQKSILPFNRGALNKPIGFADFVNAFKPLKDVGDNRKVQSYPCKFYVMVWDETKGKDNYQRVMERIVQGIFFTYRVKQDPWPH